MSTIARNFVTQFSYGFGSIPYGSTGSIIGFYFTIFLLETVYLDPGLVSIIVFGGRVWDAITDPIIGYLIMFTPSTCIGRFKPWIIFGIIPMSIFYFCLWQVVSFSHSTLTFFYYFIIYLIFQTFTTIYHLPFTAMIVDLSQSLHFRDFATVSRMFFEVFGVLLGVGIHTICLSASITDLNNCQSFPNGSATFDDRMSGYFWSSLIISILIIFTVIVMVLGTKVNSLSNIINLSKPKHLKKFHLRQVYNALRYPPYLCLLGVYMLSWLSLQILQGNFALFAKHVLKMENNYYYLLLTLVISMISSMLPWQLFMFRTSKKVTLILGSCILLISLLILLLILDDKSYVFNYITAFFAGVGVATFYLVPWSMLPDVVDDAYLSMGIRMEEMYFGFFVFFSKFGAGMSLGVSTLVLKFVDYDSKACVQPDTVKISIRVLMTAVPFVLVCLSLLVLLCYPINELKRKTNSQRIKLILDRKDEDVTKQTDNFTQSYSSITRVIESSSIFSKI